MFGRVCGIFLGVVLITCGKIQMEPLNLNKIHQNRNVEQISLRLSNTTEPIAYELWIETKIQERILNYTGRVKIVLRALQPTSIIVINSENLQIVNRTLHNHLNNEIQISHHEEYKRETILAFFLEETLRVGQNYVLDINFKGVLQSISRGFSYTRYVDEHGETFYVASTFLHVTNARMAFPCYDEPHYRTSFTIHITHHNSMRAASNMPIVSKTNKYTKLDLLKYLFQTSKIF